MLHNSCSTGTCVMPGIYTLSLGAWGPWTLGVHSCRPLILCLCYKLLHVCTYIYKLLHACTYICHACTYIYVCMYMQLHVRVYSSMHLLFIKKPTGYAFRLVSILLYMHFNVLKYQHISYTM